MSDANHEGVGCHGEHRTPEPEEICWHQRTRSDRDPQTEGKTRVRDCNNCHRRARTVKGELDEAQTRLRACTGFVGGPVARSTEEQTA